MVIIDCPGPLAETAGKSESCAGCPNQQACATGTAPTGPDPGSSLPCAIRTLILLDTKVILSDI